MYTKFVNYKEKKITLLQENILGDQKVQSLSKPDWIQILDTIITDIYAYIDTDSSEGGQTSSTPCKS